MGWVSDLRLQFALTIPDYPFAWPPHQIMAWVGLERYGYLEHSARLAYRWIYM